MILLCYGTRPEWIKIMPLVEEFKSRGILYKVLFTGQHADIGGGSWDIRLDIKEGSNRLNSIVSSILSYSKEQIFDGISYVLVQGDTTTGMALAMSAFHHQIPVIHLEAGLRTWDKKNPYPEETNRCIISNIADYHLCPTELNKENIEKSGVEGKKWVVGNTVLDTIETSSAPGVKNTVLVTMHRRENLQDIPNYFREINLLARHFPELNFVIPMHPNPLIRKHKELLTDVRVIEPVGREELINLIKKSKVVVSDSGGIQEECSFLKTNLIVCRKVTERPESVGIHSFICKSPDELRDVFIKVVNAAVKPDSCPYGEGDSSIRIAAILKKELGI